MSGTVEGGYKCRDKNKQEHGADFYSRIGQLGGKVRSPKKGFGAWDKEKLSAMSRKAGAKSRRTKR